MKITATYDRHTEKALRLSFDYGMKVYDNVWLPKSQLKFISDKLPCEHYVGHCVINIPMWLLNKQTPSHVYSNISPANAVANFITRTGGDIYCNA